MLFLNASLVFEAPEHPAGTLRVAA